MVDLSPPALFTIMSAPVSPAAAWRLLVASNLAYFKGPAVKLALYVRALVIFARYQVLVILLSPHTEFSLTHHDGVHNLWATAHVLTVIASLVHCLTGFCFRHTHVGWYWVVGAISVAVYAATSIYNVSVVVDSSRKTKTTKKTVALLASVPTVSQPQNRPLSTLLLLEDTQLLASAVLVGVTPRSLLKIGPFVMRSLVYLLELLYVDPERLYGPAVNPLLDFLQEPLLRAVAVADFAAMVPFALEANPYALVLYLLVLGFSLESSDTARATLHRLTEAGSQLLESIRAPGVVQQAWAALQQALLDLYPERAAVLPKGAKKKQKRAPSFAYESLVVINDAYEDQRLSL